jgi:hypothetical protein
MLILLLIKSLQNMHNIFCELDTYLKDIYTLFRLSLVSWHVTCHDTCHVTCHMSCLLVKCHVTRRRSLVTRHSSLVPCHLSLGSAVQKKTVHTLILLQISCKICTRFLQLHTSLKDIPVFRFVASYMSYHFSCHMSCHSSHVMSLVACHVTCLVAHHQSLVTLMC